MVTAHLSSTHRRRLGPVFGVTKIVDLGGQVEKMFIGNVHFRLVLAKYFRCL